MLYGLLMLQCIEERARSGSDSENTDNLTHKKLKKNVSDSVIKELNRSAYP
jgi:hypothetical protein